MAAGLRRQPKRSQENTQGRNKPSYATKLGGRRGSSTDAGSLEIIYFGLLGSSWATLAGVICPDLPLFSSWGPCLALRCRGGVNLAAVLGCLGAILGLSWGVWEQQENLQSEVGSFLVPVLGLLELLFAVGSPGCRFLKLPAPSPVSVHAPVVPHRSSF